MVEANTLPSFRAYMFLLTINNPENLGMIKGNEKEFADENIYSLIPSITYLTGQYERGKEGTPHLQIFIKLSRQVRISSLIKNLKEGKVGGKTNIKGVLKNNGADNYCNKDNTKIGESFEIGKKPQKIAAINYKNELDLINQGKVKEINPKLLFSNYNNVQKLNQAYQTKTIKDHDDYRGVWIWGPSHVGKSTLAKMIYPNAALKLVGNEWFDTYDPEDHSDIILNDFGLNHKYLGDSLKIWSDRFANPVSIKGSAVIMNWNNFIVTSQYSIKEIWRGDQETIDALSVRFKQIHIPEPLHEKKRIEHKYELRKDKEGQIHMISENTDEELKILGIERDQILDLSDESLVGGLRSLASRLKIAEIKNSKNTDLDLKEQENKIEFFNPNDLNKTSQTSSSYKYEDYSVDLEESFEEESVDTLNFHL